MRTGFERWTLKPISGWDHCAQSIGVILTTEVGTRVMRRAFGNPALDLQDRNATPRVIMQIYAGIARALRLWEPGFRLQTVRLVSAGEDGRFRFELTGVFYPRGHLGDYSQREDRALVLTANDNGFAVVRAA
jgi:hypothetical protein